MNRKWMLLLLMMTSTLFISGCWSKKELNELAVISAIGLDLNEEGKYVKTLQIINPGNVAGGLQGGGGGSNPSVTVYKATGDTVLEAHENASKKIPRRLYHAHADLLVISDKLAKEEGIVKILDAFERDPEIRTTMTVAIAHDVKASEIIETLTGIEKIPAERVLKTLKTTEELKGQHINVTIQDLIRNFTSPGKETVLSGFYMKGDSKDGKKMENIQESHPEASAYADGLAIFKKGKLIDVYKGEMARGVVWILDKVQTTDIEVDWKEEKEAVSYLVIRQKTKVSVQTKNGKPKITVHVRAEGDIREIRTAIDLTEPAVILDIEKALNKEIKKQLEQTIKRTQENKSDIFGFGEKVHEADPKTWKKLEDDWNDVTFPKLEVDVKVEAFVRRNGLRNKSYLSEMEGNR
ncbi:Ger(x)C family spore germination protein [Domibacillus sp. A3M-37]|uniref:Ger(x)C family spore germination protein n=1 Tax=Domibacillus sp. A3M-37 TaxID=2962037 RepID=UPI0020B6C609|nr:Ger(x)C family spore germination protein [Domibacillus sp. A3M-37]MCP3764768.1 Ger(x)C family spore germination protein [Domibacillus sp. A3M-37]